MSELTLITLKLIAVTGMAYIVCSVCLERIKNAYYGLKYNNFDNKGSVLLSIQKVKLRKDFTYMIHVCNKFGKLSDFQKEELRDHMNHELDKFFRQKKYCSTNIRNFIKKEKKND